MGWLDGPIEQGTWAGITTGMMKSGLLSDAAADMLREIRDTGYISRPSSNKSIGTLKGLRDTGLVRRSGFLWTRWALTDAGADWLAHPVRGQFEKTVRETVSAVFERRA